MIVTWLDPGLLTGVCVYDFDASSLVMLNEFEYKNTGEALEQLRAYDGVVVGWEAYTILKGAQTQAPWSLEVIGMARYLCAKHGYTVLPPADPNARKVCTTNMLRGIGWYPKVKGKKDALSAAQHMVSWMIRTNHLPKEFEETIYGSLR